jgi:multidrug resistance efflux pump
MSSDVVIRRRRFSVVGLLLFALFVAALVLHTLFDRLTPYTSEATLQAPVVGVAPNISGTIISVAVQDNQPVHAGDRLLRIDPQRFEAAVKQAEANLSDATQRVGASTAALAAAAAKVSDAKANLANERAQTERTLQLMAREFASRAQADVARAKLATAEATVRPPKPVWKKHANAWGRQMRTIRRSNRPLRSMNEHASISTTRTSRRRSTGSSQTPSSLPDISPPLGTPSQQSSTPRRGGSSLTCRRTRSRTSALATLC